MKSVDDSLSRKEVIEYLRNLQKQVEVQATSSGINLWVLWGALGLIVWTALDSQGMQGLASQLRPILLIFEASIYLFILVLAKKVTSDGELRFARGAFVSQRPQLGMLRALIIGAPSVLEFALYERTLGSFLLASYAAILFLDEFVQWIGTGENSDQPKNVAVVGWLSYVVLAVFWAGCASIAYQCYLHLPAFFISASLDNVKALLLLLASYWLMLLILARAIAGASDEWTYDLETRLILGTISVTAALAKIEHRSFGAPLAPAIEAQLSELDRLEAIVHASVELLKTAISDIEKISPQYEIERSGRLDQHLAPVTAAISGLESASNELETIVARLAIPLNAFGNSQARKYQAKLKEATTERLSRVKRFKGNVRALEMSARSVIAKGE